MDVHLIQLKVEELSRKLRDSEEKLKEAQAIAHVGSWVFHPFRLEIEFSVEACNILDIPVGSCLLGMEEFLALVYVKDRPKVREIFRLAIEQLNDFNEDIRIQKSERRFVHINLRIRSDHKEELADKRIRGTIQDISQRKEIERALKRSEEKYHALFQQSKDAIYITTKDGRFLDFNLAALELFGYSEEEMKNLNVKSLYLAPFERVMFQREIEQKGYVKDFELKLRRKDGSKLDCSITSSLWRSNNRKLLGYQGVIRDITDRKLNEELIKEKEIVERSAKMKEQFLANMSHEIRTPINGIIGLTHLLIKSSLNEKQNEYVKGIKTSSEHLLTLINDILDFSKIEAGKITFERVPFTLWRKLENLLMPFYLKAEERGNKLILDYDDRIPGMILGDPVRLNQILLNLLSNAIKFTQNGDVTLFVKLLDETEEKVVISFTVKDTGIGIPHEKQETIFSSFTQLSNYLTEVVEGTGLGLAITKQLVELQGGKISVKSQVGEGSEFIVILGFRKTNEPDDKEATYQDSETNFKVEDIGNKRILLVEDNKLNQVVATEMITHWWPDVVVDIAENGLIGVNKFEERKYDFVLMDVQMPEMDGYEATRIMRKTAHPEKQKIPIMAMTAYATTGEAEKCLIAGMNDYISKPFEPKRLHDKVISLLHHNQVLQEDPKPESEPNPEVITINEEVKLDRLRALTASNTKLRHQLVDIMIDETPGELEKLSKFILEKNWPKARGVAHKMKSTLNYLGLDATLTILKLVEIKAMEETNTEDIPGHFAIINQVCTEAVEKLKGLRASGLL